VAGHIVCPYLSYIQANLSPCSKDSSTSEIVNYTLRTTDDTQFFVEVRGFEGRAGLEFFCYSTLSFSFSIGVLAGPNILKCSRGKYPIQVNVCTGGIVCS
jgi:hypothetical protein